MLEVFTGENSLDLVHFGWQGRCSCRWRATTCLNKTTFSPSATSFGQHRTDLTIKTRDRRAATLLQTMPRTRESKVLVRLASPGDAHGSAGSGALILAPHTDVRLDFSL